MTSTGSTVELPGRAVIKVTGSDAAALLDNVVTNDLDKLKMSGDAVHSGLLTPQGKILAEFFLVRTADGFLIDIASAEAAELVKRLSMYRLRMKVTFTEEADRYAVVANFDAPPPADQGIAFQDPRSREMGWRAIVPAAMVSASKTAPDRAYDDRRVTAGVAEAGADYPLGDAFPHEANWDRTGSVDFRKGCFVGQEVVSRMQHKALVRKRVVRIARPEGGLTLGTAISVGAAEVGTVGTVSSDGTRALALLRLDRVAEALAGGGTVTAGGGEITVDAQTVAAYRAAAEARS